MPEPIQTVAAPPEPAARDEAARRSAPCLRLSVHHVGGRDGSRGFPGVGRFERDLVSVLYDADADCLAQMQGRNQHHASATHVLPYCLGDARRPASFNINYDPFTSSLNDSNPAYGSYYFFNAHHDYLLAEATRTVERRSVELVSLDQLFRAGATSVPPPDFLSLDTEGSEYDILQGAAEVLRSHLVALVVEVSFHPRYSGQKLFGEVTAFLAEQGFDFVKFSHIHPPFSSFRAPIGLRGDGFELSADAFYLRRLEGIVGDGLDAYLMARKLAFIAVVFNQFEYALECLRRSRAVPLPRAVREDLERLSLYTFLRKLEEAAERMPRVFPQTFAARYTTAASRARFQGPGGRRRLVPFQLDEPTRTGERSRTVPAGPHGRASVDIVGTALGAWSAAGGRAKEFLRRFPTLFAFLKWAKRQLNRIRHFELRAALDLFRGYSTVEAVLMRYGLTTQAELLRRNRLRQARFGEGAR